MSSEDIECRVECACKAISFEINGAPIHQKWCHCDDCAVFNQYSPVGVVSFMQDVIKNIRGFENIATLNKTGKLDRHFCKLCGWKLYSENKKFGFIGIPANTLIRTGKFIFAPQAHFYAKEAQDEVLKRFEGDGLPKYVDLPEFSGGSGSLLTGK